MERLNQVGQSAELAVAILMEELERPNPVKRRETVAALEGIGDWISGVGWQQPEGFSIET
ncbi:MAG: hypothetical protein V3T83_18665 [Acidobacteriota bacterium]